MRKNYAYGLLLCIFFLIYLSCKQHQKSFLPFMSNLLFSFNLATVKTLFLRKSSEKYILNCSHTLFKLDIATNTPPQFLLPILKICQKAGFDDRIGHALTPGVTKDKLFSFNLNVLRMLILTCLKCFFKLSMVPEFKL